MNFNYFKKFNFKKNLITSNYNNILYSRTVLYIFFALSILNLYYLLVNGLTGYIVLFFLVGFLTSCFSKNMIVIMCVALAFTNIFRNGTSVRFNEGFIEGVTDTSTDETENSSDPLSKMKSLMSDSNTKSYDSKEVPDFSDADIERMTKLTTQYEKLLDIQKRMKESFQDFKEPLLEAKTAVEGLKDALQRK